MDQGDQGRVGYGKRRLGLRGREERRRGEVRVGLETGGDWRRRRPFPSLGHQTYAASRGLTSDIKPSRSTPFTLHSYALGSGHILSVLNGSRFSYYRFGIRSSPFYLHTCNADIGPQTTQTVVENKTSIIINSSTTGTRRGRFRDDFYFITYTHRLTTQHPPRFLLSFCPPRAWMFPGARMSWLQSRVATEGDQQPGGGGLDTCR